MGNSPHTINKLKFEFFPAYADFILRNKLDEFMKVALAYSKKEDLSLMKFLGSYTEQQLIEIGRVSNAEMLDAIAKNETSAYIDFALDLWIKNQLPVIDKGQIATDDITMGAFVRRKVFRFFLKEYTNDEAMMLKILEEVDRFTTQTELLSYNVFIEIQQEKLKAMNIELSHRESQLLEAQKMSETGSFVWEFDSSKSSFYTEQVISIFGMSPPQKIDEFLEFIHPNDRTLLQTAINNAITKKEIYECDYRYIINDSEIYISSRGIVEFDGDKPLRIKGTVHDITKKRKMMNQMNDLNISLRQKNDELERTNKELESFNYIASHDLQEPLRKIMIFSSRVMEQSDILPEKIVEYIERINASSLRMQHLIEDLLSFSQISSPSEKFEEVDLNIILNEAKQLLSIEKQDLVEAVDLPTINAVPFQLAQLFTNLIGNSLKYKREDVPPQIRISHKIVDALNVISNNKQIDLKGSYLQISFEDNGIGFEPEYNQRIFDLFKRLHARGKYSGTGIGLSICKKIVHNHNGFIEAESTIGNGATFHIYLPAERVI